MTKRFADAELAAEYHAHVKGDLLYPDNRLDPDETDEETWEAACKRWAASEVTLKRFATLPHYDEAEGF